MKGPASSHPTGFKVARPDSFVPNFTSDHYSYALWLVIAVTYLGLDCFNPEIQYAIDNDHSHILVWESQNQALVSDLCLNTKRYRTVRTSLVDEGWDLSCPQFQRF